MRAALAGVLGLALLGVAAGSVGAQSGTSSPGATSPSATSPSATSPGTSSTSASDMTGRHSMQGEVTRIDTKDGWVHVKTSEGTLIVYVPPQELQSVKKGDAVTLELALKDNGPAKGNDASGRSKRSK